MKTISILQLVLAFGIGISALFALLKIFKFMMKTIYKIEEDNQAFAVFQTGIILSGAMILSSILSPALNAIRFLNPNNQFTSQTILSSLGFITIFVLIGLLCTIVVIASGLIILFQLTKVNEGEEIRNNNIAIALITAAVILALSLIVDDYVGSLCEAIIPYPEIPKFY